MENGSILFHNHERIFPCIEQYSSIPTKSSQHIKKNLRKFVDVDSVILANIC